MGEPQESASRPIFVVSDGTGDTAAAVAQATMAQFHVDWTLRRFGGIRHEALARRVVSEAERVGALIVFTLVDRRIARALIEEGNRRGVPTLDVLGGMISRVAEHLRAEPRAERSNRERSRGAGTQPDHHARLDVPGGFRAGARLEGIRVVHHASSSMASGSSMRSTGRPRAARAR